MGARDVRHRPRRVERSPARSRGVTRAACRPRSSSAPGTSTAAWPRRPRAWTGRPPTTRACSRRSSTRWRSRTRSSGSARRPACSPRSTVSEVAEPYIRRRAIRHLEKGRVVIFAGGHRQPVLHDRHRRRAACARDRRGRDPDGQERGRRRLRRRPAADADAKFLPELTHLEAIERGLKVMDTTALSLCMENGLPIHVFGLDARDHRARRRGRAGRHDHLDDDRGGDGRPSTSCSRTPRARMDRAIEATRDDFNSRPHRARLAGMLDRITVDYYGQQTPLKQLATIGVPEPRLLNVQPFDPSSMKAIEKAIRSRTSGSRRRTTASSSACRSRSSPRSGARSSSRSRARSRRRAGSRSATSAATSMHGLKELVDERRGRRGRGASRRGPRPEGHRRARAKIDELLKHKEAEIMEV